MPVDSARILLKYAQGGLPVVLANGITETVQTQTDVHHKQAACRTPFNDGKDEELCAIMAVSYTHLDVYKRQVLRDGDYIDTLEKPDFDAAAIRRLMVGRELSDNFYRTDTVGSMEPDVVLKMEHVSSKMLQDVSFELHKGEILGFGGLADCGMHELGNIAFGLTKPDLGEVRDGQGLSLIHI